MTRPAGAPTQPTSSLLRPADTQWMDLARVVATCAVVLIHVIAPVVSSGRGESLTHPRWWLGNVVDSGSRAAVPIFIMVSGALLLSAGRHEGAKVFYVRRLHRVGVPLALWSISYLLFRRALGEDVNLETALTSVAKGAPYYHLYFLFVMLGLYAATPFLRVVLRSVSQRSAMGLGVVLLALGATDQFLASFFGAGSANAVTQFVPYLGYFVIGHVLASTHWPSSSLRLPLTVFLVSTGATAWGTWLLTRPDGWTSRSSYFYGYLSPTVILASLAAFVLLRALPDRVAWLTSTSGATAVRRLSSMTFGVYLVHPAFVAVYRLNVPLPSRAPALAAATAVEWAVVIGASLVIVAMARSVPVLRRAW